MAARFGQAVAAAPGRARALGIPDLPHRRLRARANGRDSGACGRARSRRGDRGDLPPRRPQHASGAVPREERPCEGPQPRWRRRRLGADGRSVHARLLSMNSKALLLATLGAVAMPAAAEDLMQVYRDAQKYDAAFPSARRSLEAGRERLPQGRALLLPTLNLTANATHQ